LATLDTTWRVGGVDINLSGLLENCRAAAGGAAAPPASGNAARLPAARRQRRCASLPTANRYLRQRAPATDMAGCAALPHRAAGAPTRLRRATQRRFHYRAGDRAARAYRLRRCAHAFLALLVATLHTGSFCAACTRPPAFIQGVRTSRGMVTFYHAVLRISPVRI